MRLILSASIIAAVSGLSIFLFSKPAVKTADIARGRIGDQIIQTYLADTDEERVRGLSGRERLEPDKGMLFVFPDYAVRSFWMKEMKFPIDIIWIKDNRVIGIEPNAPQPRTFSELLKTYQSPEPVNYVLEVNAGFMKKFSLGAGAVVEINQY